MWPFRRTNIDLSNVHAELRHHKALLVLLEERLATLEARHLSLRGRVYARWGREEPTAGAAATAPAGTSTAGPLPKAELRRLAGIKPGLPYPHRDTNPPTEE